MSRINFGLHVRIGDFVRRLPIFVLLIIILAGATLLPMAASSFIFSKGILDILTKRELSNLQKGAESAALRVDQRVVDVKHTLKYLSLQREIVGYVKSPSESARNRVYPILNRILLSNSQLEIVMVIDAEGNVLEAAGEKEVEGLNVSFRDYFKKAVAGETYVSSLEIGRVTGRAGMFYAAPVVGEDSVVAGIAAFKMKGEAVYEILQESSKETESSYFLVNGDGVVIYHPESSLMYSSLVPLLKDVLERIVSEKTFMRDTIADLKLETLAAKIEGAKSPGNAEYRSPVKGVDEIAGFAPTGGSLNWVVVNAEPKSVLTSLLSEVTKQITVILSVISTFFLAVAYFAARMIVKPVKMLDGAIKILDTGEYDGAKVDYKAGNEIGRLVTTFNTFINNAKARERERDIFGRVVSPEVREKLLNDELNLGGEVKRVAVLFSDIRNFTPLVESSSPENVVAMLNEYFTQMNEVIRANGGYINNFIGDAIVAVFGAPVDQVKPEILAVKTAVAMHEKVIEINKRRKELGDDLINCGVGVSVGKVVAGKIGSPDRFAYTVIGDAVNVASRLEGITKNYPGLCPILFTGEVYEAARGAIEKKIDDMGPQQLKGMQKRVHVYGILEC